MSKASQGQLAALALALLTCSAVAATDLDVVETRPTWDDLSRTVVPRLIERNWDMGAAVPFVRKASCKIRVHIRMTTSVGGTTQPTTGVISYAWDDQNDNGCLSEEEVRLDVLEAADFPSKQILMDVIKQLLRDTLCSLNNVFLVNHVKTLKTEGGYQITLTPLNHWKYRDLLGYAECGLTVTEDFRVTQYRVRAFTGAEGLVTPRYETKEGRWQLVALASRPSGGVEVSSAEKKIFYTTVDGLPMVSGVTVSSTYSPNLRYPVSVAVASQQQYQFTDWKLEKRARPVQPAPPEPAKPPPQPEPLPPLNPDVIPPPEPHVQPLPAVPQGVDPKQTSDDPTYGTTRGNPIRVGKTPQAEGKIFVVMAGVQAAQEYLGHLCDAQGRALQFERRGTAGDTPDGHAIEAYELTDLEGKKRVLYLDVFHPEAGVLNVKAPVGLYFRK